jgi:hypothetical protein
MEMQEANIKKELSDFQTMRNNLHSDALGRPDKEV